MKRKFGLNYPEASMFDKNNSMTQWLIGIFVRSYSSKDYLINCAGVRQLKSFGEPFQPEPKNKDAKQFKKLFCLTPIEKSHLIWWPLWEIIMKKFRIIKQS